MSVDFPSSFSPSAVPAGKPIDVQKLQEAFAAALRSYGTEKGGTQANAMLEVLRSTSQTGNAAEEDRNQQRKDKQQHTNRNDYAQIDRKLLDKSELRQSEMKSDYQDHRDRLESLRNDPRERSEQRDFQRPTIRTDTSHQLPPPPSVAPLTEPPPDRDHSPQQQRSVAKIAVANSQSPLAGPVALDDATVNSPTGLPTPVNMDTLAMPVSVALQPATPQVFTLFTPLGRFGQLQEKTDEKDSEDEKGEAIEEKKTKKKQPFALFETIHAEASRPTRRTSSRQLQESPANVELHRVAVQPREKSTEKQKVTEPDQSRSVKSLDDLLNAPAQTVSASKNEELNQPNQTRYLHRIAAACEAAAKYAPIRIKINLEHLGSLTLRFYHKADKLMLRFETPSEESAQFLHDHLGGLKTILSKSNVKIASIEVFRSERRVKRG